MDAEEGENAALTSENSQNTAECCNQKGHGGRIEPHDAKHVIPPHRGRKISSVDGNISGDAKHVIPSHRRRKITSVSSVDGNIFPSSSSASDSNSIHSGRAAGEDASDATSRIQRPVNVNKLSRRPNVSNGSLSGGSALGYPETETQINAGLSQNISADARQRILRHQQLQLLHVMGRSSTYNAFNLDDQYRDMRMDIDNMPYEELLALGDRIGYVSTAVSEETLSKCVRRSIYKVIGSNEDGDGIKCSICQEEYAAGDEIGKLVECLHCYHDSCINQWLQHKNWCPVCKTSVAP